MHPILFRAESDRDGKDADTLHATQKNRFGNHCRLIHNTHAHTYTPISPESPPLNRPGFLTFSPMPVQLRQAIFPCRNLTETMNYKNRIIGTGTADPKTLKANALNWRKHPDAQRKAMQDVLGNIGWIQDVIINKTTGNLIDGHLRVETGRKCRMMELAPEYCDVIVERWEKLTGKKAELIA